MIEHKRLFFIASAVALTLTTLSPVANAGCTETRVGSVQCLDYKGRVVSSKICDRYSTNVNAGNTNIFSSLFKSDAFERTSIFGFRISSASQTEDDIDEDQLADVSHTIGDKPRAPTKSCPVACPQPPSSNNDNGNDNDKKYYDTDGDGWGDSSSPPMTGDYKEADTCHGINC